MNKSDLVDAVASSADVTKASAGRAVDAVLDSIGDALGNGDTVSLVGFGTFSVRHRALCLTEKVPKPTSETVSPLPNASPIESKTASTALPAEALVTSADEATASTKSDLFIEFSSG